MRERERGRERVRDGEDEHYNLSISQKYGESMQTEERQRHIDKHMAVIARMPDLCASTAYAVSRPFCAAIHRKTNNRYA